MQTKPLSPETQRIVNELRELKTALHILGGNGSHTTATTIVGQAISRLSYLDVLLYQQEAAAELTEIVRGLLIGGRTMHNVIDLLVREHNVSKENAIRLVNAVKGKLKLDASKADK